MSFFALTLDNQKDQSHLDDQRDQSLLKMVNENNRDLIREKILIQYCQGLFLYLQDVYQQDFERYVPSANFCGSSQRWSNFLKFWTLFVIMKT